MTTYSRADLATRVLKDLGLIAAEETPSATDLDWASETVSTEVALLSGIGMPIWNGSDMSVPVEYLGSLSRRIGAAIGPSFGLMSPADAERTMLVTEQNLRKLATVPATGTVQQAEYF
jgi:hypothetical protein